MSPRPLVRPALRLSSVVVGVLAVLASAGCSRRDATSERQGEGVAWSEVAKGTPPLNLILITLDTTRRDRLSCYGYSERTTPNLDRIAKEGLLFEQAYTPVPVTLPAHATMLTGLYPFQHGARHNGSYVLADSLTTLAEMLKARGYDTGAVLGAYPVERRFGLSQGFDDYDDRFMSSSASGQEGTTQRAAPEVTRLSLKWITRHAEHPFFLWVHYFDPHAPYRPVEPYKSRFPDQPYDAEVASMDAAIGELVDGLKSQGLDERTVLLIAADHGEGLGDHDEPTHCMFIYATTQDVPLLMRLPARDPWNGRTWRGRRVRGLASLTDLLPTAWNVLGYAQADLPRVAGRSLLPLVEGTGSGHEWLYHETLVPDLDYGMSELRGYQAEGWKYIRAPQPELYNLEEDPGELTNLAERERDRVEAMESALAEVLQAERTASGGAAMDEETLEKLRSLGYFQGRRAATKTARTDPKERTGVGRSTALAQTLADANRLPEALAIVDSVLKAHPETRMALRQRAQFLTRLGRGADAVKAYEAALADCQGCPDEFRLLQEQARAYLVSGSVDEALRRTRILLEARPREQGLNILLGEVLEKKGDLDGARRAYGQEGEIFPLDASPLIKLGDLAARRNRAGEAEQMYLKALSVDPGSVEAMVLLGGLLDDTGRRTEAERYIDRALELDPQSFLAHYRKAWILRASGRKAGAVPHLEAALRVQPQNGLVLYELGSLYGELGREGDARKSYERAVQTGQAPAAAYSNLAVLAAGAGRLSEAIALWQQALDHGPTEREADIIRTNIRKAQEMMRSPGAANR